MKASYKTWHKEARMLQCPLRWFVFIHIFLIFSGTFSKLMESYLKCIDIHYKVTIVICVCVNVCESVCLCMSFVCYVY